MRDIIVRIPKKRLTHFIEDKMKADIAFWRFSRKPKQLDVGDYIFFTVPEGTKYAGRITEFVDGDNMYEELGNFVGDAGNINAFMVGTDIMDFGLPIPSINYAQQGFRYLTPKEQTVLRLMV